VTGFCEDVKFHIFFIQCRLLRVHYLGTLSAKPSETTEDSHPKIYLRFYLQQLKEPALRYEK